MKALVSSLFCAALLLVPAAVHAQDATTAPAAPTEPAKVNTGGLAFTGGNDVTTAYFFRGYNQEDGGLITQPYLTVTAALASNDSFTLNAYVGTWNSFQSMKTGATHGSSWYESDIFGGVDLIFGKWSVGTVYTSYNYPNGAFNSIQEIGVKAGYDDTETMKEIHVPFALKPAIGVYKEVDDGNGTDDTYFEASINPTFSTGFHNISLSVPVVLGMSLDDYYLDSSGDNSFFGYGSIGLVGSVPLGEPGKFGAWTLSAGVQYLCLFADSVEATNNNESNQVIGKMGVSFSY